MTIAQARIVDEGPSLYHGTRWALRCACGVTRPDEPPDDDLGSAEQQLTATIMQLVRAAIAMQLDNEPGADGAADRPGPLEHRLRPIVRDLWWSDEAKPTQRAVAIDAGYADRSGLTRAMDREDARLGHSTGMWERLTARKPNRARTGGTRLHSERHAATSGVSTPARSTVHRLRS